MSKEWTPHKYQEDGVEWMLSTGSGMLWWDPGMAKTSTTLQTLKILKHLGQCDRALILAPIRPMYSVWPEEIKKWADFNDMTIDILHGPRKEETYLKSRADIHVINFDGLKWFAGMQKKKPLKYDVLVVDEISYLKNSRTQRFKSLKPLLDMFRRRYGLTGSPAPNSLMDIFGPQYVIDQGATFGSYITHFRNKYFYPSGFGGYEWKLQQGAKDAIYKALEGKVHRLDALDHLDMPEKIENDIMVDLPEEARKTYNKMEVLLIADVADGTVTATTAATASMKCQQIANGSAYLDQDDPDAPRRVTKIHDAKVEVALELVEELQGKPCMIAYHFKHDLESLKEAFPGAPVLGSGVVGDQLAKVINDWNAGLTPVLLAHPMSAGHGLNLQGTGHAVIWYSLTWSLEVYEQFVRRVWRQGQKNRIVVHHLIARNTVDEAVMAAIKRKDGTQRGLLNALKDYVHERVG